jgi:hypothetical protein
MLENSDRMPIENNGTVQIINKKIPVHRSNTQFS